MGMSHDAGCCRAKTLKMRSSCCAVGCTACYSKKKMEFCLYWFSANSEQKLLWVQAVKRKNWQPKEHSRLCSKHFISG